MDKEFVRQFLVARDQGLSPQESWRAKRAPDGQEHPVELWFVKPLELLDFPDWKSILLSAAESGARYAELRYRTRLTDLDDVVKLFVYSVVTVLGPLCDAGALGSTAGMPFCPDRVGFINVALFPARDRPEEDKRMLSREELHQRLRALDCTPISEPPITKH